MIRVGTLNVRESLMQTSSRIGDLVILTSNLVNVISVDAWDEVLDSRMIQELKVENEADLNEWVNWQT